MPHAYAIILAAGFSSRMGSCKANLPWHHQDTLLTYQIKQWLQANVQPVVVLGSHNAALAQLCPEECQVVINPAPHLGKTASILMGLATVAPDGNTPIHPPWTSLAIAAVDQPRPAAIYQRLLTAHRQAQAKITAPIYHQRLGHPLLFHPDLQQALQNIREDTLGLRQIIRTYDQQIQRIPWEDPIVLADLNTPEQYEQWRLAKHTAQEPSQD